MKSVIVPPNALQIRIPLTLPIALARARIDVAHFHFLAPLVCSARTVVQVHDISYERVPECHPRSYVLQYRLMMPLVLRRASAIITISEFSRRDIIRRYHLSPDIVHVAPGAPDPMFRPVVDPAAHESVRRKYRTGEHFLLSVCSIEPRKNLRTLIEAYIRLRRFGTISHRLVLVGRKAWLYDDIGVSARGSGFEQDIVFTDFVPDGDLPALYSASDLFVYPSLFEGFGLPPLEAMACGTPVIASNTTSLPEVVAEAGVLVDPLDVSGLAMAIAALVGDEPRRAALSRAGIAQAKRFTWEQSARSIAAVYRTVGRQVLPAIRGVL